MQYGEHSRIATGFRKPFSLNKFSLEKKELAWYDTCPWKARGLLISSLVQQIAATALKRKCVLAQLWQFQSKKSAQKKKRKEKGGPETGSWPRRRPHIYSAKQWDSFYTWSCPGAVTSSHVTTVYIRCLKWNMQIPQLSGQITLPSPPRYQQILSFFFFFTTHYNTVNIKTIQVNSFFQQSLCNLIMFINAIIQDKEFKRLFFSLKKKQKTKNTTTRKEKMCSLKPK